MECGELSSPAAGTPQGGVISPLLANVYLHEVLDVWFEREVRPRLRGRATLIRYADDIAVVFSCEDDARRIGEVLPKRFETYGLTLHPDKTRLVEFRRLDLLPPQGGDGPGSPGTFDLLGFTHFWGSSRKGKWVVKRRTACDRFNRALKRITGGCKLHRHDPVHEQWQALSQKLRGHFGYYGITGNYEAIHRFWEKTNHAWRKWLGRRSRRVGMSRDRMDRLLERYRLPRT